METTPPTHDANPYRLLQLREGAPRTLVDETYWLLVSRASRDPRYDDRERRLYLRGLNQAYETITRDGRSAVLSLPAVREKRWFARNKPAAPPPNPREMLFVSADAQSDVVVHASKVLATLVPQGVPKDRWQLMLSDAAAQVQRASPPDNDGAASLPKEDVSSDAAVRGGPKAAADGLQAATEEETQLRPCPGVVGTSSPAPPPEAEAESENPDTGLASPPLVDEPVARSTATLAATPARDSSSLVVSATHEQNDRERNAQRREPAGDADPHPSIVKGTGLRNEPRRNGSRIPLLGLVFERRAEHTRLLEEQDSRLLGLRASDGLEDNAALPEVDYAAAQRSRAPEAIVPPAPQAGGGANSASVLRLSDITERVQERTLGSGPAAAHIQIWKQGNRCLLQQLDGSPLSVNGVALTSPLVVLEHGDEVTHDGGMLTLHMS